MSKPSPRPSRQIVEKHLREWGKGSPFAFLDFEFNHSQDSVLNLVSCSLQWADGRGGLSPMVEWWLHRDDDAKDDLRGALVEMQKAGTILVGYGMAAECRSLLSLGVDPHGFRIVDLYAEWMQLSHNNEKCEYGTYFTATGLQRFSVPPSRNKDANKGRDNNKVGTGLVAAVGQTFGVFIDSVHKHEMRDLILSDLPNYTQEQRSEIMRYCSSDVVYLPELFHELNFRLLRDTSGRLSQDEAIRAQLKRGEFIASIAKMEETGFPVNREQILNLRRNLEPARETIISDLVENHYPFFVREKKRLSDLRGTWTDKSSQFEKFLKEKGLLDKWPRVVNEDGITTKTLAKDDKVLSGYDGIPEIHAYRQARKLITQLRWFKAPTEVEKRRDGDFLETIGADGRQRVFLGPYGTQTGRNAPKASRFIPAMSSWLRILIQPPEGWAVYGIDWASQEFALAAVESGDPSMMAAYSSGDPYLYFAKKAGAVPPNGTKAEYHVERNLFKSTTLGLQYGMGSEKLAVKLSIDTGRHVPVEEAERLIRLHKAVYPTYWRWLETVSEKYNRKKCLKLWDGWCLLGDNPNSLSVRNFPVQGTGAVTMREAVRLAHREGLHIMAPLHDAIYGLYRVGVEDDHPATLGRCMDEAILNVVGGKIKIRQDLSIHQHGEQWVEEKGEKYLQLLGRYLERMDTEEDLRSRLMSSIFAPRLPHNADLKKFITRSLDFMMAKVYTLDMNTNPTPALSAPAKDPTFFWVITYGDKAATFTPFCTYSAAVKDSLGTDSGRKEVMGTSTTKGRPLRFIQGVVSVMRREGVLVVIKGLGE